MSIFSTENRVGGLSIADRLDITGDCWVWTGPLNSGYGRVSVNGFHEYVHRLVWEELVGPIPSGLTLDHLCHNEAAARNECRGSVSCLHRKCVNPDHLEPVTMAVNSSRGIGNWIQVAKTHCPKNHPYVGSNLYLRADSSSRGCKACRTEARQKWERKQRLMKDGDLLAVGDE